MLSSDSAKAGEKYYCGYQNQRNSSLEIDEIVEDCRDCRESLCRKSSREEEKACLWSDYTGTCVAATKGRGKMIFI